MRFFAALILMVYAVISCCASHHPTEFLDNIAGSADEGAQIVEHYCASCHASKPLIQLGAPRIKNTHDWQQRLQQGMAALFKHTEEGYAAMPPRGGCFECSDHQLILAIDAIIPK